MPLFSYKAIDATGKAVVGRLEAINLYDLEQRLSRMELDLVGGALASDMSRLFGAGKVTRQDLINFCFHLEQLATAGVPLKNPLDVIYDFIPATGEKVTARDFLTCRHRIMLEA